MKFDDLFYYAFWVFAAIVGIPLAIAACILAWQVLLELV